MNDLPNYGNSIDTASKASLGLVKEKFNSDFPDWLALQNVQFEAHGLWCDGLVPWMSPKFDGFSAD